MANKVLLKKSSVVGKVPTTSDLSYGELALNYADGKLYYTNSANQIKHFADSSQIPSLSINNLTDVDTVSTPPSIGQVLKWNGTNWVPAEDSTSGGGGTNADTLDGFDSTYFLNYNNLSNKPTFNTINGKSLIGSGNLNISAPLVWSIPTNYNSLTPGGSAGSYTITFNLSGYTNSINTILAYGIGTVITIEAATGITIGETFTLTSQFTEISSGNYSANVTYNGLGWSPFGAQIGRISISTTDQIILVDYQQKLTSGTSIKTINGQSLLGSGDITISSSTDANTLDGFDSSYFLDYNNLSNKPYIPSLTGYATESYVNAQISNLVDSAPETLNTLNELAAALGDDPSFATTISNQIGLKANISSLATVATSGSYNDLTDKPTIPTVPTNVSAFTNDANYATQTFVNTGLSSKQNTLVSGTNIKSINGQSLLGSGNISISGGAGGLYTNTATLTSSAPNQTVDSFDITEYRTVKYLLQVIAGPEVHSTEITVIHNDNDVFINEYGTIYTGASPLVTVSASIDLSNVYLNVSPTNSENSELIIDLTRISVVARILGGLTGDLMLLSGSEDLMVTSGNVDLNV